MTPHIYGSCHFDDCPACDRIAEADHDARLTERDDLGWMANAEADRYENWLDRMGGSA